MSHGGAWGTWGAAQTCPDDYFLVGYQPRMEGTQLISSSRERLDWFINYSVIVVLYSNMHDYIPCQTGVDYRE